MDQPIPVPITEGKKPAARLWLIAGGVIVAGLIGLMVASKILNAPKTPTVRVARAPTPTPTPVRVLSAVATQSAFMTLEGRHASLSASLVGTNLDDPSLSPPALDLPLGFRQ